MADLKKEFDYYLANKKSFLEEHKGKFIVLKDCKLLGSYETRVLAIEETLKSHELGSFLVQEVSETDPEVRFHSRFAG